MATAHDVAEAITDELGRVGSAKLMKLLYYAQGWSLAWMSRPLFEDRIEAWSMGPVVHGTWTEYDAMTGRTRTGDPSALSTAEQELVSAVVDRYGNYTGAELIRMTHQEDPWQDARGELPRTARSKAEISRETMREWFIRTSFEPETEDDPVDSSLVDAAIAGERGALANLAEQAMGVRPTDIRRR